MFLLFLQEIGNAIQSLFKAGTTNTGVAPSPVQVSTSVEKVTTPVIVQPKLNDYVGKKYLTPNEVYVIAKILQGLYPRLGVVDARYVAIQSVIESGDDNQPWDYMSVSLSHTDKDGVKSYGILQVRTVTATDMYTRCGFKDYGNPTLETLKNPVANIYFSLAVHADNVTRYKRNHKNITPSEQWLIQAYNGGYGNGGRTATPYYKEFIKLKAEMWARL